MGIFRRLAEKCYEKFIWRYFVKTMFEDAYQETCQVLDKVGVDYRVWMDEEDRRLVFFREYFDDPVVYRRQYIFYVKRSEYRTAYGALKVRCCLNDRIRVSF